MQLTTLPATVRLVGGNWRSIANTRLGTANAAKELLQFSIPGVQLVKSRDTTCLSYMSDRSDSLKATCPHHKKKYIFLLLQQ